MLGLAVKAMQNGPVSPRSTMSSGEIDTTLPFQSVKAAVSLFGEVGSGRTMPVTKKSKAEERVLEKETQHHMMRRELDYYKDQLKSAETAKAQASRDLQRANRTLNELKNKLEILNKSKKASIRAAKAAKIRAKELEEERARRAQLGTEAWKLDVENEKERYKACTEELIVTNQELENIRQEFDAALDSKQDVFQKAEDAQNTAQMLQEKQNQLLKEVSALRQKLDKLKLTSLQAQEEHSKLLAEKEAFVLTCKSAKEEAEKEIKRFKGEYEPKENLQEKLDEITMEVKVVQEQLNEIQLTDEYYIKFIALQIEKAKKGLQEVVEEERSLRSCVDSMKMQLEEVKREHSETEQKALEAEKTIEQMQADLEKSKNELEEAVSGCASVMQSSLEKIYAEAEKARLEAEDIKKNAESLKQEAEARRIAAEEAEEKLKTVLKEVEEAKAAEKLAGDQIYNYARSEADSKGSGCIRKIRLSAEEFESMNKKIEAFKTEADVKVATAMAQIETINASEKEASQKLEVILKENEAVQSEIDGALKTAEMAEAAKAVVESVLQKWRQSEQNEV